MMNGSSPSPTRQDIVVRTLMWMSIFVIGLYSSIIIGLANIFSDDIEIRALSMFLIFVGLMFCHTGAALGIYFRQSKRSVTKGMFCICFVASFVMVILGLSNVFSQSPAAIYLILVGFVSAVIAALSMN